MQCTICLEDVDEEEGHAMSCGHRFHSSCLIDWLLVGTSRTCPTCRSGPSVPPQPQRIDAMTARMRCSYLRTTVARRRGAPTELLRQIGLLRRAEGRLAERKRHARDYHRLHAPLFSESSRLRERQRHAELSVRRLVRLVGHFQCPGYALPPVLDNLEWM